MNLRETPLRDLWVVEPTVHGDSRGLFLETYKTTAFAQHHLKYQFVQDNMSVSHKKTLRGFHLQRGEAGQAKLVWVAQGEVLDYAIDLRPQSETFGRSYSLVLNDRTFHQLLIPRGFAHGFICLSDRCVFSYKVDNFYSKEHEIGIRFDDPDLKIALPFPAGDLIVSDKDRQLPSFRDIEHLL